MNDFVMEAVPVHKIGATWVEIKPLLDSIFNRMECHDSLDDIYKGLITDNLKLFIGKRPNATYNEIRSIAICDLIRTSKGLVFRILYGAGDAPWRAANRNLIDYALRIGCISIQVKAGRKGWVKKLSSLGYKVQETTLEKDLYHGKRL